MNFFEPTFIQQPKIISFVGDNKKIMNHIAMLESVKLILNAELIDFFDNQRKMVRSKIIIVIFSFEEKGPNFLYWSSMKLFLK